ncbi:hypothetical protein [Pseudonocardia sp. H11422]|uniref:hypothetical protein n=1 Tax=Pseudonocardia sp. H11422 TaxID=2835866 RepID=UPI001BDD0741|nr:hypothetical protein [Pseudonocardia sp. H11422]
MAGVAAAVLVVVTGLLPAGKALAEIRELRPARLVITTNARPIGPGPRSPETDPAPTRFPSGVKIAANAHVVGPEPDWTRVRRDQAAGR